MKIDDLTSFTLHFPGAESDGSGRPKSQRTKGNTPAGMLYKSGGSVAAVRDAYRSPSTHAESDHSDVEDERRKKCIR
jgi:hypothetical protein